MRAVDSVVKLAGLSEEQRNKLLIHFSEPTKYGLVNAVANLARDTKNVDEQIRLEGFGGRILETSEKDFEEMLT